MADFWLLVPPSSHQVEGKIIKNVLIRTFSSLFLKALDFFDVGLFERVNLSVRREDVVGISGKLSVFSKVFRISEFYGVEVDQKPPF